MNTLTFSPLRPARQAASRPVRLWIQALATSLSHEWTARQAERRLAGLDEAALHDMGLTRGEIASAVRQGRPRR